MSRGLKFYIENTFVYFISNELNLCKTCIQTYISNSVNIYAYIVKTIFVIFYEKLMFYFSKLVYTIS